MKNISDLDFEHLIKKLEPKNGIYKVRDIDGYLLKHSFSKDDSPNRMDLVDVVVDILSGLGYEKEKFLSPGVSVVETDFSSFAPGTGLSLMTIC